MTFKYANLLLIIGFGSLSVVSSLLLSSGMLFLLTEVLVIALLAQMWNLLAGYGGMVSLGQQAFVGLGGYGLYVFANHSGLPVWLWIVVVPLMVGVAALPLGMLMFKLKSAYFSVGMWVAAEILAAIVMRTDALGQSGGLVLRPGGESLAGNPERILFAGAGLLLIGTIVGLRVLLNSDLGLALLAMRDGEEAAEAAGVNVRRTNLLIFCIAAAGCAAGGALYYFSTLYIAPTDAFQINWLISMMFVSVIGGVGTLTGPLLGTAVLIAVRETCTSLGLTGGTYWIIMGTIAIATLLILPRGLWPALRSKLHVPKTEKEATIG